MIVFHEGLPGSGKSYEACVVHILEALNEGRPVITNIEGIDHKKFSDISKIPLRIVEQLINCIYHPEIADEEKRIEAQKKSFLEETENDSLVVWDEIQDHFPTSRQPLSSEWSKYVTEHRHKGLDIILMGQDRRDCHNLWRRRIQRCITFMKRTGIGKPNSYVWTAYEHKGRDKYDKISSGTREYEKKYFGLYKSHTDGTKNTNAYSDDRTNVLKTPLFKYGPFLAVPVIYFVVTTLSDFFSPKAVAEPPKVERPAKPAYKPKPPSPKPTQTKKEKPPEPPPLDEFDKYAKANRVRMSGWLMGYRKGEKFEFAYIDILTKTNHIKDRYTLQALIDLGWEYETRPSGILLTKMGKKYLARPWPIDNPGKINRDTRESLVGR